MIEEALRLYRLCIELSADGTSMGAPEDAWQDYKAARMGVLRAQDVGGLEELDRRQREWYGVRLKELAAKEQA